MSGKKQLQRLKSLERRVCELENPETHYCSQDEESCCRPQQGEVDSGTLQPNGQTLFDSRVPFPPPIPPIRLPLSVSVDASTDDNGFLQCCICGYSSKTIFPVGRHHTTAEAFSLIRSHGHSLYSVLVGHGAPGFINTGTGQNPGSSGKYMSRFNESEWRSHAALGVPGSQLTLFGCEVAGGAEGAAFLSQLANRIRKPVGAWTGLVWCQPLGCKVWGTGDFIRAEPGKTVEPMESPSMYDPTRGLNHLSIQMGDGFKTIKLEDVLSVEFSPIIPSPLQIRPLSPDDADATKLLQQVDFENPFVTEDKPASIRFGQLIIAFRLNGGERLVRTFSLLGCSLLQDACFTTTYYYVSPSIRSQITIGL